MLRSQPNNFEKSKHLGLTYCERLLTLRGQSTQLGQRTAASPLFGLLLLPPLGRSGRRRARAREHAHITHTTTSCMTHH